MTERKRRRVDLGVYLRNVPCLMLIGSARKKDSEALHVAEYLHMQLKYVNSAFPLASVSRPTIGVHHVIGTTDDWVSIKTT